MDYELALELKNAGFPQIGVSRHCYTEDGDETHLNVGASLIEGDTYIPTLDELIDACGKPFYRLHNLQTN